MQTLERIRDEIEKEYDGGNFLQRLLEKIRRFSTKKKEKENYEANFEKINALSLWEKIKFAGHKRVLAKLYDTQLQRLREAGKHRKIRVMFLINLTGKWHCKYLYDLFDRSDNFEPLVLATKVFSNDNDNVFYETLSFLENSGMRFQCAYDPANRKYLDLKMFNPDIVFYPQPWGVTWEHCVPYAANFALTCYTPYCFHLLHSEYDYLEKFHRILWKYFVESPSHLESYQSRFKANNCVSVGSLHLDGYLSKKEPDDKFWKDKSPGKKRIIYAPHFSITANHRMATFHKNGKFMLNLADMYGETTWVVRPHPSFRKHAVKCGLMTKQELADYCSEWEKYGTIFEGGSYIDLFKTSDCLITDSISFLADYFPTGKPVFHLRSDAQAADFNTLGKKIVGTYYQIHSNAELERLFSRVIIGGDDFMAPQRHAQMEVLGLLDGEMASKRVLNYLKAELKIQ